MTWKTCDACGKFIDESYENYGWVSFKDMTTTDKTYEFCYQCFQIAHNAIKELIAIKVKK